MPHPLYNIDAAGLRLVLSFSLPFLSSADEEASLSLDLDRPTVEYGGSVNYTILLENSGREDLTDISISDNFGQVGFIALLPAGESFEIERTTPPGNEHPAQGRCQLGG